MVQWPNISLSKTFSPWKKIIGMKMVQQLWSSKIHKRLSNYWIETQIYGPKYGPQMGSPSLSLWSCVSRIPRWRGAPLWSSRVPKGSTSVQIWASTGIMLQFGAQWITYNPKKVQHGPGTVKWLPNGPTGSKYRKAGCSLHSYETLTFSAKRYRSIF